MFSAKTQATLGWKLTCIMLGTCLSLVGCSSGVAVKEGIASEKTQETKIFHVATEMDQIVKDAIDGFPEPLPPEVEWMQETPAELKNPNAKYEQGVAEGVVTFYWLCAWEKSFLDNFNEADQADQDKALAMVQKFPETPWYKSSVSDPEKGWMRDVVTPAKLGDPSGMKREFESACSKFSF